MKVALTFSTAVAVAMLVFGWFDTATYREARQAYLAVAGDQLPKAQEQIRLEEARYRQCDALRVRNVARNTIDFSAQGRQCVIDALGATHTVQGALTLGRNATVALAKNPQDQQLRTAALAAIGAARQTLASQKPWLYDRLEQLNHAYADSVVLRVFSQPDLQPVTFESQAALLDQTENAIHRPQLYLSQQIWRMEALFVASK